MRYIGVVLILLIPLITLSLDFYDDFEGFNIGDDIGISDNWTRDGDGHFYVVDDGGDQIIETDFSGGDSVGYICKGSGYSLNAEVDADFKYNGMEFLYGLALRTADNGEV